MTHQFIHDFIAKYPYAVLSTINAEGRPEAALVGIAVTQDLELIFDTSRKARKFNNLIANPSVAFVIGWDNEQTLQYEGIASQVPKHELDEVHKIYAKVFPDSTDRKDDWRRIAYFRVKPRWVRYSDFNKPETIKEERF